MDEAHCIGRQRAIRLFPSLLVFIALLVSIPTVVGFQLFPPEPKLTQTRKPGVVPTFVERSSFLAGSSTDPSDIPSVSTTSREATLIMNLTTIVGETTSILVSGVFFVVLAWQRDAIMVSFFVGSISNSVLSKVLKKIINQTRPPELSTKEMKLKPSDGGMPSSHAMSLGFIGMFTGLYSSSWMTSLSLGLYVIISLAYRIQASLHTWQQITVGSLLGSTNGFVWWHLCTGENPWKVNLVEWALASGKEYGIFDANGVLSWPFLVVPVILGVLVVGSVERRIDGFLESIKKER